MQVDRKSRTRLCMLFFLIATPSAILIGKSVVLFSPDDRPTKHLIKHIGEAKSRIYAAVYMLTDKKIATALIDATKRGIDVQIITDQSSVDSPYGKAAFLKQSGVAVSVFRFSSTSSYNRFNPLMHNKFAIIDNYVWTGSFNWTVSANNKNQENVIYTDETDVCEKYLEQFDRLTQRSISVMEEEPTPAIATQRSRGHRGQTRILPLDSTRMNLPSRPIRR